MTAGCHYSKLFGLETGVNKGDKCLKCGNQAAILLAYGPQKFCEHHFSKLIESRFRKTVRKFSLFKPGQHIAVGVSGGKDSLTCLFLLNKFFSKTNKITAVMIDEGIPGYRDNALKTAKKYCKEWKIEFREFSFKKEFGIQMQEIQEANKKSKENLGSPCTFCGTLRRTLLNKAAIEVKADILATGHNLDDETQGILMNACDNDLKRFVRGGAKPGLKQRKGLVQRIKPLIEVPEREIFYFTQFNKIESYTGDCCPFSEEAKRNDYRSVLNQLEERFPGTKHSLWQFYCQIRPGLAKGKEFTSVSLNSCSVCKQPCSGKKCEACKKLEAIKKIKG